MTIDHHEYCTGGFSPDDVVISGISGRFPECNSVRELKEALLSQKNILLVKNERYERGAADLPFRSAGTVNGVDEFDLEFFGYSMVGADHTEPQQRMIMEVSYEAIADAGYEATTELRGCNVGIYSGVATEEARDVVVCGKDYHPTGLPGFSRCMLANRVAHVFDFHGSSFTVDTGCSSSLVALRLAYDDIKSGVLDAAVVNASQLCFNPVANQVYASSGILSDTNESHPFEARANGIVRTEAVTALFLQKASVARRAYATIVTAQHSSLGICLEGPFIPNFKEEVRFLKGVMKEANLSANDFQFIEAHGSGFPNADEAEVKAIDAVFCQGREEPLYIGSTVSNVGYGGATTGQTATIKAIIAFETGLVAPNYGFQTPNPNIEALAKGTVKVVTEPLPLKSDYIPVNSFGFGGTIVQTILKKNPITYVGDQEPQALPRLVLSSATTEEATRHIFEYIQNHPELRDEFFALLNKLSFAPVLSKPIRGYALFQEECPVTDIKNAMRETKREVWFVMTGMGCQWPGMGLEMMKIKVFSDSMKKSAAVVKPFGLDLFELIAKDQKHLLTNRGITPAFVSICAIQIALVDVIRSLDIQPDGMIGHSSGELVCAYADGCCTAEQTLLAAYWRGNSVESANLGAGAMAAVGLTWEEAVRRCPEGVYPACHNAEDSVTISGVKEPLEKFVAELQQENIFARVVDAYGYAFHCEHVWPAAKSLRHSLLDLIPNPLPRSKRWVSSSYPEDEWELKDCKVAGAEYFVHNLMSRVRFHDALKKIPSDALTIEIGPHFLLQSVLKRGIGLNAVFFGLMKRNHGNNVGFFLESVGKLYVEGLNPKIETLYRPVKFPVPRGTPMISDLIRWNHSQTFRPVVWKTTPTSFVHKFEIQASDGYLLDHYIDGKSLFPATGYVFLAWSALARKLKKNNEEMNVVVENFKIHRAVILSPTSIYFDVTILDKSGKFEIIEGNATVASGTVYTDENIKFCETEPEVDRESSTFVSGDDLYNELRIHGYQYGPAFRKLLETSLDGTEGFVEWDDNWITLMDALLLFFMFRGDLTSFMLPTGALSFKIAPKILKASLEMCSAKKLPGLPVTFHKVSKTCRTVGLEIRGLEVDAAPQRAKSDDCILEEYKFVPYMHTYKPILAHSESLEKYMMACNKFIDAMKSKTTRGTPGCKFNIQTRMDFDLESYMEWEDVSNGHHQLLLALKAMTNIETDAENRQLKDIFRGYIQDAGKDVANSLLLNDYCLRYMFEIITENSFKKLSVVEISNSFEPVLPAAVEVVEKNSMLKFKSKILVADSIDDGDRKRLGSLGIQACPRESLASMAPDGSQSVVISALCISTDCEARKHLRVLSSVVEQKGFILLFHKYGILPPESLLASLAGEVVNVVHHTVLEGWFKEENLVIVSRICDELGGSLYLLRRAAVPEDRKIVRVSEDSKWFDELKLVVCGSSKTSWVTSEDNPSSGIVGMINCLRNEPGGDRVRCLFVAEKNKEMIPPSNFNFEDKFFEEVLKKDLVMNVYKDGTWGSFRHVQIEKDLQKADVNYSYVNIKKYGDLSTLTWMQSSLELNGTLSNDIVHTYYCALNFRDIMLASGKISTQTAAVVMDVDKCVLGLEFSGKTRTGKRIAGICSTRGLATCQLPFPEAYFIVPDEWSMEDAATVPIVYVTCYYSLMMRAELKRGESILIHSGTGGVGQAAINIANSLNCEIYTTVGTEEKRRYLLDNYPCIRSENIGCSRDTSFERMILKRTNGRGVDVVLNSLADDKFMASLRCVAKNGRFVEIGKYDLAMDREIDFAFFLKNITIHGVFLDKLLVDEKFGEFRRVLALLNEGIRTGVVKPLKRTVFQRHEVEKAFRYMAGGTHMGKVLVKIRDEEKDKQAPPKILTFRATPVTYFHPHKVYIVIGGLGGFGIEVSKWILGKGAKNLVLTTRYGARTPYHQFCLKRWKDEGNNVVISKRDVSNAEEAAELLREVSEIGPVGGIFNSAVVLHDAFLENTSWEHFKEVCAPKAHATKNLDELSRLLCPELDHFVCFSSISCGRGNAGQMNYGYANSVMERVCERRQADGLPGLAIQWGIIGEVGVVHRHMGDDAMIAGVGAQKVKSCLNILDVACQMKRPVVSSYVIKDSSSKEGEKGDVMQQLAKIFGLKDASEFNTMRSFSEMGVDSLMGVEVKHLLESNCDTTFTMKELQDLKIDDVKALLEKAESQRGESQPQNTLVCTTSCVSLPRCCVHPQAVERLNDIQSGVPVFFVDIDNENTSMLRKLSGNISQPVFALLLSKEAPTKNLQSLASWFLERITEITRDEFHLVAYSSASAVGFEIALQNQKSGKRCPTLTFLSGSNSLLKIVNKATSTDVEILCGFVENYIPSPGKMLQENLSKVKTLDQQIRIVVELFTKTSNQTVDKAGLAWIVGHYVNKVRLLEAYEPKENLVGDILVIEDSCKLLANDVAEVQMLLAEICSGKITVQRLPEISDLSEIIQRLNSSLKSPMRLDQQPLDKTITRVS